MIYGWPHPHAAERGAHRPIDHVALCALVSDTNEQTLTFHRYNNDGASSSVHSPTPRQQKEWPGLSMTGNSIELLARSLESILDEVEVEVTSNGKSLLVLDVQGHEAAVLAGIGRYARTFDLCQCEISQEAIYDGGALYPELKIIFEGMGYVLKSHSEGNLPWHGDVIFERC